MTVSAMNAAGRPLVVVTMTSSRSSTNLSTQVSSHGCLKGHRYGLGDRACLIPATGVAKGRHPEWPVTLVAMYDRPW